MKRFLFAVIAISAVALTGCSKDDVGGASYTILYSMENYTVDVDLLICEYNDAGDRITTVPMDNVEAGDSMQFIAHTDATKVKIYLEMNSSPRWVQQVFILNKGSNTNIEITDDIYVGRNEP